jgi:anti-sigma factor RsiW
MNLSDEKLVAYIDGELDASESAALSDALANDADARERLETLQSGGRPFAEAFDAMLDAAPDAKLQAMFAGLVAQGSGGQVNVETSDEASSDDTVVPFRQRTPPQQPEAKGTPVWQMAVAAVLLAAVFTGGLISGGILNEPQQVAEQQQPGWREAAARYVALFSRETLEGMPSDSAERLANLAKAENALGLQLTESRIADPDLDFHGTQLLNFNGKPLAQIAYLHGGQQPVALCIIAAGDNEPAPPANETRQGMNIVHWVEGGFGYMVIGDVPEEELNRIAERFRTQFS